MKKPLSILLTVIATVSLVAVDSVCGYPARKNIELGLREVKIGDLSSSGLTISFHVWMQNNSSRNYALVSYQYQVLINEKEYFRQPVSLERSIDLPAGSQAVINFPVRISYQYLKPYLTEARQQATCRLSGDLVFQDEKKKTEKVSLNLRADFPIFKLPQIRFLSLLVRDLTLGGADFDFRFVLGNPNPYDLLIQNINLELLLEGRSVYSGQLAGDKTLAAGESKTYSLPLMLDFFEQGRELREGLEKDQPSFTLKLRIEADSAWGWLDFPLEATAAIGKEFRR
ncbi:MAG: LEA type 2 family protein [Candidatus Saccharicenans sp.]|nr:LEA type 2 family protein [Candidatus Saccharicenans sp.]